MQNSSLNNQKKKKKKAEGNQASVCNHIPDCVLHQVYNLLPYPCAQQKNAGVQAHIILVQLLCHIFDILLVAVPLN